MPKLLHGTGLEGTHRSWRGRQRWGWCWHCMGQTQSCLALSMFTQLLPAPRSLPKGGEHRKPNWAAGGDWQLCAP